MARMHSYYVANAKDEIKYSYQGLNDSELETMIQRNVPFGLSDEEDDFNENDKNENESESESENENENDNEGEDESSDEEEQLAATQMNQNPLTFDQLIDINDQEFRHALEIEVSVLIPATEIIEHGNQEFDIQSIVETAILRRSSRLNSAFGDIN
jgi:hypothetical protein